MAGLMKTIFRFPRKNDPDPGESDLANTPNTRGAERDGLPPLCGVATSCKRPSRTVS